MSPLSPSPVGLRRLSTGLGRWLRRDGLVLLLYLLATLLLTAPLVLRLGGEWMPVSRDLYMKLWDVWWFEHLLETGQPFYYTHDLFHPTGLDLTYHPTPWTVTACTWILSHAVGVFTAYKLMVLLSVFLTAYGAYLLVLWLTRSRAAAWLGGAVYSFAPYHLVHAREHPDVAQAAPVPLTALLFLIAMTRGNLLAAAGAGLMLGVVAWTGLYLMGMAVMTLGLLFLWAALEERRWRQPRFWGALLVFALAATLLLAPRLAPIFRESESLRHVVENKYLGETKQADLLAYLVPHQDSALGFLSEEIAAGFGKSRSHPPYLGLLVLAAVVSALLWRGRRRGLWVWAAIALLFFLLSLGPVLRFNGEVYEKVRLPAALLHHSVLMASVRPHFFHVGLLLPLAVLSGYGFSRWLGRFEGRPRAGGLLALGLALLLLAEYRVGSFPLRPLSPSPFHEEMARDGREYALIDLPMDYRHSKSYLYFQTVHGKPIGGGMSSRMPAGAFRYIDANPLLARWRAESPLRCEDWPEGAFREAVDALLADGFRYVLTHDDDSIELPEAIPPYFRAAEPHYLDERLAVYALEDLREYPPCPPE